MPYKSFTTVLFTILLSTSSAQAQIDSPATAPWMQPEVIAAALQMQLTTDQRVAFHTAISGMVNGQIKATNNVLRRNNVTNLPRKLKMVKRRALNKFDKQMAAILTAEQQPSYQIYLDLLATHMTRAARGRSSANATAENGKTGVLSNRNPDWH